MTDIVERLREQGKDAFQRQYSLGMFKLCDEAADEIELLRQKLQFAEFEWNRATLSWQDAERRAALTSTERSPTENIEGGA